MKRKNCVAGTKVVVKDFKGEPSMDGWNMKRHVGKVLTIIMDDGLKSAPIHLSDNDGKRVCFAYPEWLKLAEKGG